MNLINKTENTCPVPDRIIHKTEFGAVDHTRGNNAMNPLVTIDDPYYWLRDDERKNVKVLDYLNSN